MTADMHGEVSVTVSFERKVSDRNYGSETAAATVSGVFILTPGQAFDSEAVAEQLRLVVREVVRRQLMDSPDEPARQAAETPEARELRAETDRLRLVHDRQRSRRRAIKERLDTARDYLLRQEHAAETRFGDAAAAAAVLNQQDAVAGLEAQLEQAEAACARALERLGEAGGPEAAALAEADQEDELPF